MRQKRTPGSEQLSLESVKAFLRIPDGVPCDELEPMIAAAVAYCENVTGRCFGIDTITVTGSVAEMARLPLSPVIDVVSAKWFDQDEGEHTMAEGEDFYTSECGFDVFCSMPGARERDPVEIVYTAGYDEIPSQVKQAILMLISHWYDNRSSVMIGSTSAKVEMATDLLLRAYKAWWY